MSIRVIAGSAQAVVANDGHAWALRGTKFSLMWWDRIPIAAGITRAFQHATSGGTNRFIAQRGGGGIYLGVLWSTAADFNVTSGLADDGEWHCSHVVYDAGSTANVPEIYFDGVPQSVTVANAPTGSLPATAVTDVGTYGNRHSLGSALGGILAHVAMWGNHLLSIDEVLATFREGPLAMSSRPTLYRPFDPSLPGGILRALGTADGPHLNPKGAHLYPFADADDPYGGRYVGGRRYRANSRTTYRTRVGPTSGAVIACDVSVSFATAQAIAVDKPIAAALTTAVSTSFDVSVAKPVASAMAVAFATSQDVQVNAAFGSALSVMFATTQAVGVAKPVASALNASVTTSQDVLVAKPIASALSSSFAVTQAVNVAKPVGAACTVAFTTTAAIAVAKPIAANVAMALALTGNVTVPKPVASGVVMTFVVVSALTPVGGISGRITGAPAAVLSITVLASALASVSATTGSGALSASPSAGASLIAVAPAMALRTTPTATGEPA